MTTLAVTSPGITSRGLASGLIASGPMSSGAMSSGRQVSYGMISLGLAVAAIGIGAAALLSRRLNGRCASARATNGAPVRIATDDPRCNSSSQLQAPTISAARRLNRAAGMLAFSVLADSGMEHYRGSFKNRAMYIPLAVSSAALAVSAHGVADQRHGAHVLRDLVYAAAALTGFLGTGFHIYNIATRPGRFSWVNAFYGAPLGAPSAIIFSGLLGFMAERIRDAAHGLPPKFLGLPAGRFTAGITAAGLLGTTAEAGFLHFRGAYHDPFMFVPVTIPPAAALVMGEMALRNPVHNEAFSRWWLRLTTLVGFAGMAFHSYGVHRNMGGWRNWRQNLLNGPPLPAPPAFAGLALAGLAALTLLQEQPNA